MIKMLPLKSAIEQYIDDYLLVEKGLSAAAVSAYSGDLRQYRQLLEDKGIKYIEKIELKHIEDFIINLRERGLASASVARKVSSLRNFHKFCLIEGLSPTDPSENIKIRQPLRKLPKVIPLEAINTLMELPLTSTPAGKRDRSMLETLYGCGLRISELTGLNLTQIHLKDGILRVEGKGGKTRFVPIGMKALEALSDYIETARPDFIKKSKVDQGRVYLNKFGKPLSRVGAYNIVKGYIDRAFPGKDYTPHTIRHSFATHIIEGGGDIRTVQELLGHVSIATTQIYTHLDRKYLQSIVAKYHPRG